MPRRLSLAALVLVAAVLSAAPALAATAPVGAWTLDQPTGNLASDSSGNGNNGFLSGGVTWVPGVFGSALSFDGSSGEVKVADNDALEPSAAVTVSAWFKHGGSPGTFRYIVAKGGNGCVAASYGLYSGPTGGLAFYVSRGHGSVYALSPDAGTGVWDDNWHLAVGTFDGSTIRLYVDGVQVGSGTPSSGALEYLLPDSNDFYIGNYPNCQQHWFLGDIDDVVVWSRALSPADIAALKLLAGAPGQPSSPSGGGGTQTGGGQTTTSGSGTRTSSSPGFNDLPSIHGVKLSTRTVTVDIHGRVASGASSRVSVTYTESRAARMTLTLLRSERGVRRGKGCVKPPPHARRTNCIRFVPISRLRHADAAGRTTLRLDALLAHRLTPGTYRLDMTPRASGRQGATVSVRFAVRRSRLKHSAVSTQPRR